MKLFTREKIWAGLTLPQPHLKIEYKDLMSLKNLQGEKKKKGREKRKGERDGGREGREKGRKKK